MGRARTVHHDLPPGMRRLAREYGTYYTYEKGGIYESLGKDLPGALRRYHELTDSLPAPRGVTTLADACPCYLASTAFNAKAERTRRDNLGELNKLRAFFDGTRAPAVLDDIKPRHVALYRDDRASTHSTQEIALLSAIWDWAREVGLTDAPNPTHGVRRNKASAVACWWRMTCACVSTPRLTSRRRMHWT